MKTLKEARLQANLRQSDLAIMIKKSIPDISNYEAGITIPSLETCYHLQTLFKDRIDFGETLTPLEKFNTTQAIIELYQTFPIEIVSEFVSRTYRRNQSPETIIQTYAKLITGEEEQEKLIPFET